MDLKRWLPFLTVKDRQVPVLYLDETMYVSPDHVEKLRESGADFRAHHYMPHSTVTRRWFWERKKP